MLCQRLCSSLGTSVVQVAAWVPCRGSDEAAFDSPFVRMLAEAEAKASTPGGAALLWEDKAQVAAVSEMLKRPASGSAYTQWAASNELRMAAKVQSVVGLQWAIDWSCHLALSWPLEYILRFALAVVVSGANCRG